MNPSPQTAQQDGEQSSRALYSRYERARAEGGEQRASSLWREYCRAVQEEMQRKGTTA